MCYSLISLLSLKNERKKLNIRCQDYHKGIHILCSIFQYSELVYMYNKYAFQKMRTARFGGRHCKGYIMLLPVWSHVPSKGCLLPGGSLLRGGVSVYKGGVCLHGDDNITFRQLHWRKYVYS